MFVFWKNWRALFSFNTRVEIRPFALLPKNLSNHSDSDLTSPIGKDGNETSTP